MQASDACSHLLSLIMMNKSIFYLLLAFTCRAPDIVSAQTADLRNMKNAVSIIPDEGYCDQPYVVKTLSGEWLCVITTGPGGESQRGSMYVRPSAPTRGNPGQNQLTLRKQRIS